MRRRGYGSGRPGDPQPCGGLPSPSRNGSFRIRALRCRSSRRRSGGRGRWLPGRGDLERLFSEAGAYLVEIGPGAAVPTELAAVPHQILGVVTAERVLRIRGAQGVLELGAAEMEKAWGESFREVME